MSQLKLIPLVNVTQNDGAAKHREEICMKNAKPGRLSRIWKEWLRSILLIVLVITSFRSAVADWNDVPTGSMKPTILEGDRIFVNKLAYDLHFPFTQWSLMTWGDPERGEIVVLRSPTDDTRLVKRVIGLPGDRIEMRNNQLIVNGENLVYTVSTTASPANESMLAHEMLGTRNHALMITPGTPSRRNFEEITIPPNAYLVLGDNRDKSLDSRYFGVVDRSLIIGQATAVAASVDPARNFLPRWKRFFTSLE